MIDDVTPSSAALLVRYDATIAVHATAAAFRLWRDRLLLLFGAVLVVAAWRTWLADRPPVVQCWTAFALGAAAGLAFGRMVTARLRHHATDGPLAVAALQSLSRRCYMAVFHLATAMVLAAMVAIARPGLIAWSLGAYLLGAVLAQAAPAFDTDGQQRLAFGVASP